jgi:hypothetical protein
MPFSRWSIRKLAHYLATDKEMTVMVSRERLRQILAEEGVTFQRTKTWKESPDPHRDQKLSRIEWLLEHQRDRTFAFDEFGPLAIKPEGGSCWAQMSRPHRLRANYHKPHGTRQLFAWYSIGSDRLYGRIEPRKGAVPTLRALKVTRAQVQDGEQIYVILDNLNHHKGKALRQWCEDNAVELASGIREYIGWRNANTRDPEVLALGHKHRAMLRGGPTPLGPTSGPSRMAGTAMTVASPEGGTATPSRMIRRDQTCRPAHQSPPMSSPELPGRPDHRSERLPSARTFVVRALATRVRKDR